MKEEGGNKVYQGAVLSNYSPGILQTCAARALADIKQLEKKMREQLEWSDVKMPRAILVLSELVPSPSSNTEEEEDDLAEIREEVEYISQVLHTGS